MGCLQYQGADILWLMNDTVDNPASKERRTLLKLAALAALGLNRSALAQGLCRDGYGQGRCPLSREIATRSITPIFEPTGWKTTALESITFEMEDAAKEAAFFAALLGWRLRSHDDNEVIMDIGNWGSAVFKQRPLDAFSVSPPSGRKMVVSGFAFVVEPWDARRIAAELERRGINAVADNRGKFQSFHLKDPDGWSLQVCNGFGLAGSRAPARKIRSAEPLPFAPTGWETVWLDHLSFHASDYKKSASFYTNLLGWTPSYDEGSQNELLIGDVGDMLVRGGNPFLTSTPVRAGAFIDHISFGIAPWDVDGVRDALLARGLPAAADTSSAHLGPDGKYVKDEIHQAAFQSFHTVTPNGFDLQISWMTKDKRLALATAVRPKDPQ